MNEEIAKYILKNDEIGYLITNKNYTIECNSDNLTEIIKFDPNNKNLIDQFPEFIGLEEYIINQYNKVKDNDILYQLFPVTRIENDSQNFYIFTLRKYNNTILFVINKTTTTGENIQNLTQAYHENALLKDNLKRMIKNRNQYFAFLVHELKNPINSIFMASDLLGSYIQENERAKKLLTFINEASQTQLISINKILDITKIDASYLPINYSEFILGDLIENIFYKQKTLAENKKLELINDITSSILIESDFSMMETIFMNLINNAIKYTESGSVEVRVEEKEHDLLILVSDTGIGIPTDMRGKIFDAYTRLKTTKEIMGTGIGLALVKRLVKALKGIVWVEDGRLGKGTTFVVLLPKNTQ